MKEVTTCAEISPTREKTGRFLTRSLATPKADVPPTESRSSEISLLNIASAFAGCTRAPWTVEHGCAGRIELLFVVGKAKGHAAHIWDSACAVPHRIRRAGICIRLSIGNCWQGCRDHGRDNDERNGAQFTHDVALQFWAQSGNDHCGGLFRAV